MPLPTLLQLVNASKWLKYLRRESFVHQLIGKHEQLAPAHGAGFVEMSQDGKLTYEYHVPRRICGTDGAMPLSAIVALVDETTTWASIANDKNRRPGVSITLDAVSYTHLTLPTILRV